MGLLGGRPPRRLRRGAGEALAQELCGNGLDDDCDGQTDEGFDVGAPCDAGEGACRRQGQRACSDDGLTTVCNAVPGQPGQELCGNDVDDDCDGQTDEGFDVGEACDVGVGACYRQGENVCTPDGHGTVCNVQPGDPVAELCGNDLDDDCDGEVDEGYEEVGEVCSSGLGACERPGTWVCAADRLALDCTAVPAQPGEELCGTGVDEDCDGAVDEGFEAVGLPCTAGIGICLNEGAVVCSEDRLSTECDAEPGAPGEELCNSEDDDCDGPVDEGDLCEPGFVCAAGACMRLALLELDPREIDFGEVEVGQQSAAQVVVLANTGDLAAQDLAVEIVGDDVGEIQHLEGAADDCGIGGQLAPGTACDIRLSFQPVDAGALGAVLQVGAEGIEPASAAFVGRGVTPCAAGVPAEGFPVRQPGELGRWGVRGVAVDADGATWVTGATNGPPGSDFALWKFDARGILAPGFPRVRNGDAGGNDNDRGWGIAVDPGGDVWIAGVSLDQERTPHCVVWKYGADGSLLGGFPKVSGPNTEGLGITVGPDGSIWATGWSAGDRWPGVMALWKFMPDGTAVDGFPKVMWGAPGGVGHDYGYDVAVDATGDAWVVGNTFSLETYSDFVLWRFDPAGNLRGGFPIIRHGDAGGVGQRHDAGFGVAVDGEGSVWATGYSEDELGSSHTVVWRFQQDGELSPGFPVLPRSAMGIDIAVSPPGCIWVFAGWWVWRLDRDGEVGAGFPLRLADGEAQAGAIGPNGSVTAAGVGHAEPDRHDLLLWRFE